MRFPVKLLEMDKETLLCGDKVYRASLVASTKATYSLSNRAFFFEGNVDTGLKNGDYCKRDLNGADGGVLLCMGVHDEPHYAGFDYCFFARCNTVAEFLRKTAGEWHSYLKNALVYKVTTTRSDKAQNDGLLDQTIYVCYMPAAIGVKKDDLLLFDGVDRRYRVDSVDDGLTLFGDVQNGCVCVQLSYYSEDATTVGEDDGSGWGDLE